MRGGEAANVVGELRHPLGTLGQPEPKMTLAVKDAVLTGLQRLLSMSTFVVHPQLLPLLATEGLATAKPGFLDRLIHAEATTARLPLVTFEKAAARLPHTQLLKAADH